MTTFTTRPFGIEIEAFGVSRTALLTGLREAGIEVQDEGYHHQVRPHWKIVSDSSIQAPGSIYTGFELVSPILVGEAGLAQITTVCRVLQQLGAKVNKTCGLHVHHAAQDLSIHGWKDLVRLYSKHERGLDSIMPESRRGNNNSYCQSLLNYHQTPNQAFLVIGRARTLSTLSRTLTGSRFFKLNLDAFPRHGTVEFRHHSGTVEAEKMVNWVKLTQAMVERANKTEGRTTSSIFLEAHQQTDGGTLEGLFQALRAYLDPQVRDYYRGRAKSLQDPNHRQAA